MGVASRARLFVLPGGGRTPWVEAGVGSVLPVVGCSVRLTGAESAPRSGPAVRSAGMRWVSERQSDVLDAEEFAALSGAGRRTARLVAGRRGDRLAVVLPRGRAARVRRFRIVHLWRKAWWPLCGR